MRRARAAALLVSLVVGLLLATPAVASAVVVSTPSGPLNGVTNGAINEWRGVPYAQPPVGDLRFRAPQPVSPWSIVRDATSFAPPCLQPGEVKGSVDGSEDCLYLNVFAPAGPARRLPVMVHIHGGGNFFFHPQQDAAALASRGVIVVSLAYRLGVLGFAGHPALTAEAGTPSGEYALLDQLQALRWVHDNIAAFGGDPDNVTLFGFSAGSFDAAALMMSPLSRGLIARAAIQGEHFQGLYALPMSDAETLGIEVATHVGCNGARDVPACLRAAPAADLVNGTRQDYVAPRFGGQVLPRPPLELLAQARRHVPLLIGFDREEDVFFTQLAFVDEITEGQFRHRADVLVGSDFAPQLVPLYPFGEYGSFKWAYVTMETDAARGCPTRRIANAVAADAPVYRFLFTHVFANDPFLASFRSFHGSDDSFLWHDFGDYVPSPGEEQLANRMATYWTNFAKTGDPNGRGLPPWPRYRQPDEQAIVLDDPIGSISRYHVDQCGVIDSVPVVFP